MCMCGIIYTIKSHWRQTLHEIRKQETIIVIINQHQKKKRNKTTTTRKVYSEKCV